ncbi:MAG: hypothetical protein PHG05_03055 [Candidatus Nanoarchaeia archaeon]|nr:hypothetical protein [Candidatus Nanoarchaeia archaeon]
MDTESIKHNARIIVELAYRRDELIRNNKKTKDIDKQIQGICYSIESSL